MLKGPNGGSVEGREVRECPLYIRCLVHARRTRQTEAAAGQDVAKRAGDCNRYAQPSRGRDRLMDRLAVERERDAGQRAAAYAH